MSSKYYGHVVTAGVIIRFLAAPLQELLLMQGHQRLNIL